MRANGSTRHHPQPVGAATAWLPDLKGCCVVVVAGGPSVRSARLKDYWHKAVFVTVNNAAFLAPFAVMAYGCDARWWRYVDLLPEFNGVRVSQDEEFRTGNTGVRYIKSVRRERFEDQFQHDKSRIIWAGNGGTQVLNLIAHAGPPAKICLVGYDMHLRSGKNWHRDHPWRIPALAANVERHRRVTDAIAKDLQGLGIDVVNCSPGSALTSYRFSTLKQEL